MRIFKGNLAMYLGKSIRHNLMSSTLLRLRRNEIFRFSFFVKRKPRDSRVVGERLTGEQKTSKKVSENDVCGRLPCVKGAVSEADWGIVLTWFSIFLQSLRLVPRHLPLHKGGLCLVPLKRVYVIIAWLAGQSKTHLCVASIIRVLPETEIPPVWRGDFY